MYTFKLLVPKSDKDIVDITAALLDALDDFDCVIFAEDDNVKETVHSGEPDQEREDGGQVAEEGRMGSDSNWQEPPSGKEG